MFLRVLNPDPFPVKPFKNSIVTEYEFVTVNENIGCVTEFERSPSDLRGHPFEIRGRKKFQNYFLMKSYNIRRRILS